MSSDLIVSSSGLSSGWKEFLFLYLTLSGARSISVISNIPIIGDFILAPSGCKFGSRLSIESMQVRPVSLWRG